mgnify:CR=1 FL=1
MNQVAAYTRNTEDELPLRAYALILSVFLAGFGSLLVRAGRKRRLPERISTQDVVLLGVATHRLTRIITRERVTATLRFPFTEYEGSGGAGEVKEHARGHGLQRAIGTLLTCQFCAGPWAASALTAGLIARPRETRVVASMLAMVTLSDFLHQAYARIRRRES